MKLEWETFQSFTANLLRRHLVYATQNHKVRSSDYYLRFRNDITANIIYSKKLTWKVKSYIFRCDTWQSYYSPKLSVLSGE